LSDGGYMYVRSILIPQLHHTLTGMTPPTPFPFALNLD
jgi:hypothetical protein